MLAIISRLCGHVLLLGQHARRGLCGRDNSKHPRVRCFEIVLLRDREKRRRGGVERPHGQDLHGGASDARQLI